MNKRRAERFKKNFDLISLPLEGMSVSEAVDAILSDPKGYAEKEEKEPLRKRQNQFERYVNCRGGEGFAFFPDRG